MPGSSARRPRTKFTHSNFKRANLEDSQHRNAELGVQVQPFQEELKIAQLTIEKLKVEVAYLRRMKYGRSSERLEHGTG